MRDRLWSIWKQHRFIIILVVLVIAVHGGLCWHIYRNFPDIANSFDRQYTNISEHLYRYGVYSTGVRDAAGNLLPTLSEPPLYTIGYFLSYKLFGVGRAADEAMRILQMLLNVGVILVSWRIGKLFSEGVGKGAAVFAAFDLTAFYFANNFQIPDTTLGFFMALWLLYLVKFLKQDPSYKNIIVSCLFFGLAMWTKIAVYMLWVPLMLFLIVFLWRDTRVDRRRKVCVFTLFVMAILLFFGGWKMRNYYATGYSAFSSGATSLRWNAAHLVSYQENIPLVEARERLAREYMTPEIFAMGEGAAEQYGSRRMASIILNSPVDFGVVVAKAMPGMFLGTFPPYMLFTKDDAGQLIERVAGSHGHRSLLSVLWKEGRISYIILYVGAKAHLLLMYGMSVVASIVLLRDKQLRWVLGVFFLTVAYTVAVSGAAAQARYRTIIFPIFYVLGGFGAAWLWNNFETKWNRQKKQSL